MKKIIAAILAAAMITTLSGCGFFRQETVPNGMESYDFKEMNTDYIQLKAPSAGDKIAVIDTDYGEVRVVLYEEQAPNTVAAFIKNAEAGLYNDMPVKGVQTDVYFLTGGKDGDKDNYVGRDSDDELIDNEYSVDLWPFTGALLSFSEEAGKSDARWFIINNDAESLTKDTINELIDGANSREDETEREKMTAMFETFYEVGGVFGLAGVYTVFGQTYLGLDVVQKLAAIPADDEGVVTETVMIKSVTISEFKDGDPTDEYPRERINSRDELYESASDGETSE